MIQSTPDVTRRLDRLEREVGWWRIGGCGVSVALAAIALMGQALPSHGACIFPGFWVPVALPRNALKCNG